MPAKKLKPTIKGKTRNWSRNQSFNVFIYHNFILILLFLLMSSIVIMMGQGMYAASTSQVINASPSTR